MLIIFSLPLSSPMATLPKEGGFCTSSCSTGDTRGKNVTLGSFPRKELPDSAEEHRIYARIHLTQIRPLRGLGLSAKGLLSSVAYGATSGRALRCSLSVQAMLK
jgi:hypothetical protein